METSQYTIDRILALSIEAESRDEIAVASVLRALVGAATAGSERELCLYVTEWSRAEVARLLAIKSQCQGHGYRPSHS